MPLPALNKTDKVMIAQKVIHKGILFAAVHNGQSTVALDESFGLELVRLNDQFISLQLYRFAIDKRPHTNVKFSSKPKKTVKKLEINKEIKQEELL